MRHGTKRRTALTGVVALGLALSACASGATHDLTPGVDPGVAAHLLRAHVGTVKPGPGVRLAPLRRGMMQLGYALAQRLHAAPGDGNVVYSPASLATAFAMVREGAAGQAAEQIDQTLHLPANRSQAFNALLAALHDPGSGNVLTVGDAVFAKRGYAIHAPFLDALMRWYGAGVYQTTFPAAGTAAVNQYVDQQTHGLIPQLITNQFTLETVLALINTLYLDARWQDPFDPDLTSTQQFAAPSGSVPVKMMTRTEEELTDYAQGPGWQAVRLPYRGDRLSMEVLVPADSRSPVSLLSPQILAAASAAFGPAHVDLSLPRWDTTTHASLKATLMAMGMTAPFVTRGFPGITDDPTFKLDSVVQQTTIDVGEKGTLAAAATSVEGIAGAAFVGAKTVDADHPFGYAIVDNSTGVPLFEGIVSDPAAAS